MFLRSSAPSANPGVPVGRASFRGSRTGGADVHGLPAPTRHGDGVSDTLDRLPPEYVEWDERRRQQGYRIIAKVAGAPHTSQLSPRTSIEDRPAGGGKTVEVWHSGILLGSETPSSDADLHAMVAAADCIIDG